MRFGNYARLARQALRTEKGKALSRRAADGLADAGNRLTKNRYADSIEKARLLVQHQLGEEKPPAAPR